MSQKTLLNFKTKLLHWEYWPTWVIYFPVFFYYIFLSVKARSFFFFSMANPGMEMGGLYNCSKNNQLTYIPSEFKPITLFVKRSTPIQMVHAQLLDKGLGFPLIAKPDRGERGKGVEILQNKFQLDNYLRKSALDFLLQEYIDSTFEAGVFYYKFPGQKPGFIPSLVIKNFLTIKGDGKSTVRDLIDKRPRARLVADELLKREDMDPEEVLPEGKAKLLEPIGNHNRGTKFLDGNHLINQDLLDFFYALSGHIPHFHYGRFDLRAPSEEDFKAARGIKILEVNGVNAEPAHIYDPSTSFWNGVLTLLRHWKIIYAISLENKNRGYQPVSFGTAWRHFQQWKKQH